jgi:hypothetical protein
VLLLVSGSFCRIVLFDTPLLIHRNWQDGKTFDNELEAVQGMKLSRGYISPHFVTDQKTQKCVSICSLAKPKNSAWVLSPSNFQGIFTFLVEPCFQDE